MKVIPAIENMIILYYNYDESLFVLLMLTEFCRIPFILKGRKFHVLRS